MPQPTIEELAGVRAHELHHRLRAHAPVVWLDAIDGWLVVARAEAVAALRDSATFTVDDERFSTAVVVGRSMLSTDGVEHARQRAPFVEPFSAEAVRGGLGPMVEALADDLVDRLFPAARADLRVDFAGPLAVGTVVRTLGLGAEPGTILDWYRRIVAGVDALSRGGQVPASTDVAVAELRRCVGDAAGRGGPLGDAAQVLDHGDLFSNAAVVLFGAIETSEGMIANALWHLLADRALTARIAAEPELVADLVEESLRLEPAAAAVDRYATRRAVLGGVEIQEGALVRISLAAANRDPAVFADPDRFVLSRSNARHHLAFVQGPHVCLGLHLARAQAAAAVAAVVDRLPTIELEAAVTRPTGLIFRKPRRLPARW